MISSKLQEILFAGTSHLTEHFPRVGSRFLDATVKPILASSEMTKLMARKNLKELKKVKDFRKILVIPDTHIGDTVMMQAASIALRDYFPNAEIHYVTNRVATPLVDGNPDLSKIIPLFAGGLFPSQSDIETLRELTQSNHYDLCLNLCAFIQNKDLFAPKTAFLNLVSHTPVIIRNEDDPSQINHFLYQCYRFIRDTLATVAKPVRPDHLSGVRTTYSDSTIEQALKNAANLGIHHETRVVMINPDTASEFTLLPFEQQAELLHRISQMDAKILLGAGHTVKGLGQKLINSLPRSFQERIKIIPPELPLEVYSALIDSSDILVTGDTGPMHIAASRRFSKSGKHLFRNKTSILSIFGATPPRMSGYDSFQPGYLPPNQDAPSWSYTAGSPCRNITCLNKMFKTCSTIRCFETVDIDYLAGLISNRLKELPKPVSKKKREKTPTLETRPS
jgi:hypothetical protein